MEFEDKLKQLIKSKYSKLSDLAEKFEMNYTQLSQYVNGKKVSIEFLAKIIKEFPDADLNWLLRNDYNKEKNRAEEPNEPYRVILNNEQIIEKIESLLSDLKNQISKN